MGEPGAEGGAGNCPPGGSSRAEDGARGDIFSIAGGSTDGASYDAADEGWRRSTIGDDGKLVGDQFGGSERGENEGSASAVEKC